MNRLLTAKLPRFTAEFGLAETREQSRGVFMGHVEMLDRASVIAQWPLVHIERRCCPSGDCDTCKCVGTDKCNLTCTNGKANMSCQW